MASSGEGIPLDDMKQGDKSQGEDGKRTNKNKHNKKQKGPTSSNPSTDKPDESKSEAPQAQSEGNSVHPETSKAETETRDDPKEAASSPLPTPAEDVEECSKDQQKKPCVETPVIPIGEAGDGTALQQKEHGSNPSSGDTSPRQGDDNGPQDDNNEKTPKQDTNAQMDDEIRKLKEELAKKEKEHQMADEHVKHLLDKIEELHKINETKDKEIEKLRDGIKAHEESALNIMKRIQEEANKNNSLESTVANLKDENSKHQKEKTRMDGELKNFKSQVNNQKTIMEGYVSTIKTIKKEKEEAKKQSDKDYKKLKEEKEKNEEQFGKERTRLTLRKSELEATVNNKNREHEAECKRLKETISKGTQQLNQYYAAYEQGVTKISQLEGEVQKLKLENHDLQTYKNIYPELKQQIKSLGKTVQDLENQKEDLMLRLSKIAGANLTYNNPNIADLSDEKRPTKLAEEFSELYDNEWTDAFEEVEAVDDKSRTQFLFDVLKRASEYCTDLSTGHDAAIKRSFTTLKYEVTVPTTEDSETVVDTSNDTKEATKTEKIEKQEHEKDTPDGAKDSTTADKVDKQEHDEGTSKGATEAVPMDNEDGQENDNTNNDLPSDDKSQKDDKQENKEDDDFVHVDKATDAESNEATNAMNATTDSSNIDVSPSENSESQVGIKQDVDTPKDNCEDISKTEDEQGWCSVDTKEEDAGANAEAKQDVNEKTTKNGEESESLKEPKANDEAKDEKLLNSPDQTTNQETSDGVPTVEESNENDEEDTSLPKDEPTKPIHNTESKHDVENDDVLGTSVVGNDNEGNATSDGNNATNETKFKDKEPDTNLPEDEHAETVDDTNVEPLGKSVDNESNSEPQKKDSIGAKANGNTGEARPQDDGKETNSQLTADRDTNAANSPSGESNGNSTGTSTENKPQTTKTMEISKIDFNFEDLSNEQLKMIMDLKKVCEVQQSKDVKSNGAKIIAEAMGVSEESKEMMKYILKCIDICWSMHRHEPPVHINFTSHNDGVFFDKNVYRPYTKSGKHIDYVVWPSLHLHKDGPMLSKGVAQGK